MNAYCWFLFSVTRKLTPESPGGPSKPGAPGTPANVGPVNIQEIHEKIT
jgi:hypothetical protein